MDFIYRNIEVLCYLPFMILLNIPFISLNLHKQKDWLNNSEWWEVMRYVRKPFTFVPVPWVHKIFQSLLYLHLSLGLQFDLISKISPQFCSPWAPTHAHALPPVGLCVCILSLFSSLGALRRLRNRHLSWIWPSLPTGKGSGEHHMSWRKVCRTLLSIPTVTWADEWFWSLALGNI